MSKNSNQSDSKGLAIAALACGILSIITVFVIYTSVILAILAIVFGSVALKSSGRKKAIAGIITGILGIVISISLFALVIWTRPALQANQRDNLRKNDVSVLVTNITDYRSNNRGILPASSDLSTKGLGYVSTVALGGEPTIDTAVYTVGENCDGVSTSNRSYSVSVLLENGEIYCQGY